MPSVLITRPQDVAETLATQLERRGYLPVIEPMLMVKPLMNPLPQLSAISAVMITSGYALLVFEQRPDELMPLFSLPCFCVGPRTAERARRFGFTQVMYGEGDGIGLANIIAATLQRNTRLIHIAAGSPDIKMRYALESIGYRVHEWPVYETVPVVEFSPRTVDMFKTGRMDAITAFSTKTAQVFAALIRRHALEACCKYTTAICLGRAIAEILTPIGWRHLIAAPKPTEDDVLAILEKTCPVNMQ